MRGLAFRSFSVSLVVCFWASLLTIAFALPLASETASTKNATDEANKNSSAVINHIIEATFNKEKYVLVKNLSLPFWLAEAYCRTGFPQPMHLASVTSLSEWKMLLRNFGVEAHKTEQFWLGGQVKKLPFGHSVGAYWLDGRPFSYNRLQSAEVRRLASTLAPHQSGCLSANLNVPTANWSFVASTQCAFRHLGFICKQAVGQPSLSLKPHFASQMRYGQHNNNRGVVTTPNEAIAALILAVQQDSMLERLLGHQRAFPAFGAKWRAVSDGAGGKRVVRISSLFSSPLRQAWRRHPMTPFPWARPRDEMRHRLKHNELHSEPINKPVVAWPMHRFSSTLNEVTEQPKFLSTTSAPTTTTMSETTNAKTTLVSTTDSATTISSDTTSLTDTTLTPNSTPLPVSETKTTQTAETTLNTEVATTPNIDDQDKANKSTKTNVDLATEITLKENNDVVGGTKQEVTEATGATASHATALHTTTQATVTSENNSTLDAELTKVSVNTATNITPKGNSAEAVTVTKGTVSDVTRAPLTSETTMKLATEVTKASVNSMTGTTSQENIGKASSEVIAKSSPLQQTTQMTLTGETTLNPVSENVKTKVDSASGGTTLKKTNDVSDTTFHTAHRKTTQATTVTESALKQVTQSQQPVSLASQTVTEAVRPETTNQQSVSLPENTNDVTASLSPNEKLISVGRKTPDEVGLLSGQTQTSVATLAPASTQQLVTQTSEPSTEPKRRVARAVALPPKQDFQSEWTEVEPQKVAGPVLGTQGLTDVEWPANEDDGWIEHGVSEPGFWPDESEDVFNPSEHDFPDYWF